MIPPHKTKIVSPGIVRCRCGWKFYSLDKDRRMLKEEAEDHMKEAGRLQVSICEKVHRPRTVLAIFGMVVTIGKIDAFKKTGLGKKSFPSVEERRPLGVRARGISDKADTLMPKSPAVLGKIYLDQHGRLVKRKNAKEDTCHKC